MLKVQVTPGHLIEGNIKCAGFPGALAGHMCGFVGAAHYNRIVCRFNCRCLQVLEICGFVLTPAARAECPPSLASLGSLGSLAGAAH